MQAPLEQKEKSRQESLFNASRSFPPQFMPQLEREFQQRYYINVRHTLRIVVVVLAILFLLLDEGTSGQGISEAQARQLFVAFGRLETHAAVEGTGLGLLSVQKIVEAHGGEAFIEGHVDGTPATALFTTAQSTYPSLWTEGFRTAFVVMCPLKPQV